MEDRLDSIEKQLTGKRNFDTPPLHLWDPPLSGDIAINIDANGQWFHDGGSIKRPALVNLFASILRREADGDYYLVTPAEKWRIQVALHPLMVTDVDVTTVDEQAVLRLTLNTGRRVDVGPDHPLELEPKVGQVATVPLANGLSAIFTRSAWYRLVALAEESEGRMAVRSGGFSYDLGSIEGHS